MAGFSMENALQRANHFPSFFPHARHNLRLLPTSELQTVSYSFHHFCIQLKKRKISNLIQIEVIYF